jgi:hypothetical protein
LVNAAACRGVDLRMIGSAALYARCSSARAFIPESFRDCKDVDFIARASDASLLEPLFKSEFGYIPDRGLTIATEGQRWTLMSHSSPITVDVFFDAIHFTHRLDLRHRLPVGEVTVSAADLLLSKLQYLRPRADDLQQMALLVACHDLTGDDEGLNMRRVCDVLSASWGYCYTAELGLKQVIQFVTDYDQHSEYLGPHLPTVTGRHPDPGDKRTVNCRLEAILSKVRAHPKTWRWKLRSLVGTWLKWYDDVEDPTTF